MKIKQLDSIILLADSSRGTCIPKYFVDIIDGIPQWDVPEKAIEYIKQHNTMAEGFWGAWCIILDCSEYVAENGDVYTLHHDGDLWAICYERMTDEEKSNFGFDE